MAKEKTSYIFKKLESMGRVDSVTPFNTKQFVERKASIQNFLINANKKSKSARSPVS